MHVLAPPGLASLLGGLSKGGTHALQCQHDFLASFTRPQQDCARGIGEQGDVDRQPTQQRRDVGMTCEHTAVQLWKGSAGFGHSSPQARVVPFCQYSVTTTVTHLGLWPERSVPFGAGQ